MTTAKDKEKDYEASPFQNRPAYRYIRPSDKMPNVGDGDGRLRIKLFNPTGIGTWYIAEYDPETRTAYGLVEFLEKEYGYFSMAELVEFRGQWGLPIERDLHFKPVPLPDLSDTLPAF